MCIDEYIWIPGRYLIFFEKQLKDIEIQTISIKCEMLGRYIFFAKKFYGLRVGHSPANLTNTRKLLFIKLNKIGFNFFQIFGNFA